MEIYIYQSAQHMWRRSLKSMLASNTIHNDLLDTMLQICKHEVLKEIKSLNSIAVETGKTTDTSNNDQMVVIICV